MSNNFISFLQFPFTSPQVQCLEQKILERVINELGIKYLENTFDLSNLKKDKLSTYSYLISEKNYFEIINEENQNVLISHKLSEPVYISYSYAVHNLSRFYPVNANLNFEEIKGLNILDKILVPTEPVKNFLIKNHIDENKIVFLPFPLTIASSKPETYESGVIVGYCNFKDKLWQILLNSCARLMKKKFQLILYIADESSQNFEKIKKEITDYYQPLANKFRLEIYPPDKLNFNISTPENIYIDLTDNFSSSLRLISALASNFVVLARENIFINDLIENKLILKNNFTQKRLEDLLNELLNNFVFYKSEILPLSEKLKEIHSVENYENYLKAFINRTFNEYKIYQKKYLNLKSLSKKDFQNLSSTKKLFQVIQQVKNINKKNGIGGEIVEVASKELFKKFTGISPFSYLPFTNEYIRMLLSLKIFLKENPSGSCLIFNQVLECVTDNELKNILTESVNNFSYIIISCRSENYPGHRFRTKNTFLELVKSLSVIQESYYGNPDLRLAEKELFLIVIRGNDNNINEPDFITWEGQQFFYNSLAAINRELELKLIDSGKYELSIVPQDFYQEVSFKNYSFYQTLKEHINKILLKKTDFYIRHNLPANFSSPTDGYYILIIPWEFGIIPENLVRHINREADRVWCPSHYVKKLHIASGVLDYKIKVIPNGINPEIYNPGIKPYEINTQKNFKFLFLGGLIYRKGIDILLEAYTEEFIHDEDVTLIIKGLGQNSYYEADHIVKKIKEIFEDKSKAEIVFIEQNFSILEMGSIYTACDCYVHPYRGEGFCMPLAESMACGLPVITTGYGPSLDFCNSDNSFLIDYKLNTIIENGEETIVAEPNKENLKKLMRYAFSNQEKLKKMGLNATKEITGKLNWNRVFKLVEEDFHDLKQSPVYRKNIHSRINKLVELIEKTNPHTPSLTKRRGEEEHKKLEKILAELEKIVSDRVPYLEVLGNTYYRLNNYNKALECFSELIKLFPNDKQIIIKLSDTLEKLGDLKTANTLRMRIN